VATGLGRGRRGLRKGGIPWRPPRCTDRRSDVHHLPQQPRPRSTYPHGIKRRRLRWGNLWQREPTPIFRVPLTGRSGRSRRRTGRFQALPPPSSPGPSPGREVRRPGREVSPMPGHGCFVSESRRPLGIKGQAPGRRIHSPRAVLRGWVMKKKSVSEEGGSLVYIRAPEGEGGPAVVRRPTRRKKEKEPSSTSRRAAPGGGLKGANCHCK